MHIVKAAELGYGTETVGRYRWRWLAEVVAGMICTFGGRYAWVISIKQ